MPRSSRGFRKCWPGGTQFCSNEGGEHFLVTRSGSALSPGRLQMIFVKRSTHPAVIALSSAIPVVETAFCADRFYSAGTTLPSRISRKDCRKIWIEDVRNRPAIIAATKRSGHFVAVPQTAKAAAITATLPMASLREHNQTERTLASPSL